MTDRPILFSAPMVRALLDGRKTQTRRVIKPQPTYIESSGRWCFPIPEAKRHGCDAVVSASREWHEYLLPHQRPWFAVGDRLWVREAWRAEAECDPVRPAHLIENTLVVYEASPSAMALACGRLRAAMHMPKWASRITLIVEDVKVERLQDISEEDAIAEGCTPAEDGMFIIPGQYVADGSERPRTAVSAISAYDSLWQMINGASGPKSWDANPWVAAHRFRVIKQNIDQIGGAS